MKQHQISTPDIGVDEVPLHIHPFDIGIDKVTPDIPDNIGVDEVTPDIYP